VTKRKPEGLKRGAPPPAVLGRNLRGRPKGQIYLNLEQLAETPGEWGQVSTRSTKASAQELTYHLRRGEQRTPPGTWEILYGPIDGDNPKSEWGVWARLTDNDKEGDSATSNAG
jgi:hypothetical protein